MLASFLVATRSVFLLRADLLLALRMLKNLTYGHRSSLARSIDGIDQSRHRLPEEPKANQPSADMSLITAQNALTLVIGRDVAKLSIVLTCSKDTLSDSKQSKMKCHGLLLTVF